jgi:hypothetical protein
MDELSKEGLKEFEELAQLHDELEIMINGFDKRINEKALYIWLSRGRSWLQHHIIAAEIKKSSY